MTTRETNLCLRLSIGLALSVLLSQQLLSQASTVFQKGDRVAILGNTFAERLGLYGYFEAALLAATPELELTVRNLAWSADEVALRPRPLNFGTVEDHLEEQRIDVALLFYGANESFAGAAGVEAFKVDLEHYLERLQTVSVDGVSPRLVLISPIPQEQVDRLPDPEARNHDLDLYRQAIGAVALERDLPYVDIFARTQRAMDQIPEPLTINGLHLNEVGDRIVSSILLDELGWSDPAVVPFASKGDRVRPGRIPVAHRTLATLAVQVGGREEAAEHYSLEEAGTVLATGTIEQWQAGIEIESPALSSAAQRLRETVNRKSRLFFDRYRAVNGYYIYGERRNPFGVVSFPPEMQRFDELVGELDSQLHRLARVPETLVWQFEAEASR